MFSGNQHKTKKINEKRQLRSQDNQTTKRHKSNRIVSNQPRLPDYLVKHKDAPALRTLLANTTPEITKEMRVIIDECGTRHFNLDYLHDWLAIYQFLRDPEQVTPYLDQLEAGLQQYAAIHNKRLMLQKNDEDKLALPNSKQNPYERQKILSQFMYEWAHNNGFQQRAKFIGLLSSRNFQSLLRAKTIFKDSSVSANIKHGAWSHAIQWYCIMEHQKQRHFLHHHPLDVLKSFGDQKQLITARSQKLAWDMIADNPADVFFCSPIAITAYMIQTESMQRWPLLAGTIARQENKSNIKYGDYRGYTKYLADKHHSTESFILKKL